MKILWIDVNQTTPQQYDIESVRYSDSPLIWNTQVWTRETEKHVLENGLENIEYDRLAYRNTWVVSENPRTPYERPLPAWLTITTKSRSSNG